MAARAPLADEQPTPQKTNPGHSNEILKALESYKQKDTAKGRSYKKKIYLLG
jgi:hypothetical protein